MEEILAQLKKLGRFEAWGWSHAPKDNYGVVSQDGETALRAGDKLAEKMPEGTIDWFSRDPGSGMPEDVGITLDGLGASWYLNSVQYEPETGLIHWEWVWQYG